MPKWGYLFEVDETLRQLERAAKGSGSLDDWAAYRSAARRSGFDPIEDPLRILLKDHGTLKKRLGIPLKLPADFEGDFDVQQGDNTYKIQVRRSPGEGGGVGKRLFIECPMCGKYVPATMSSFGMGNHLKKKDHAGIRKKPSFNRMVRYIRKRMAKEYVPSYRIESWWTKYGSGITVILPEETKDAFLRDILEKYPQFKLDEETTVGADRDKRKFARAYAGNLDDTLTLLHLRWARR